MAGVTAPHLAAKAFLDPDAANRNSQPLWSA